jgi:tRNA A37 threonylcarbamoyladenosine dehydratase
VSITNINRQIIASFDTIGKDKADVMKDRIMSVNPNAAVSVFKCFYLPENADAFDLGKYSYVVDAVGNGQNRTGCAREGSRRAGHKLYGNRKQAESVQI